MATAGQWVFDAAMHLMDEGESATGATDIGDNRRYKLRTPTLLTLLCGECAAASPGFDRQGGGAAEVTDLTLPLELEDGLCRTVLPYGLAAHLLADENPRLASFFHQRYQELLAEAKRTMPAVSEPVTDLYGGIEHGRFGRW